MSKTKQAQKGFTRPWAVQGGQVAGAVACKVPRTSRRVTSEPCLYLPRTWGGSSHTHTETHTCGPLGVSCLGDLVGAEILDCSTCQHLAL